MDKAILLALAASFCTATSSVCQRRGARNARSPGAAGVDIWLIFRLARHPIWLAGLASMILGFAFQLAALHFGALALVQPILALELLFVFGYMTVLGSGRVKRRDWLAAAAMSAGLSLLLFAASPSGGRLHAPGSLWGLAGLATLAAVLAGLALASGLHHRSPGIWTPPGSRPRGGHRDRLGLYGGGDQGVQLPPRERRRFDPVQLEPVRPYRRRCGNSPARFSCTGRRSPGRIAARVHDPRSAGGQPARNVPFRRANPSRSAEPGC